MGAGVGAGVGAGAPEGPALLLLSSRHPSCHQD